MKKLILILAFLPSVILADWLDEIADSVAIENHLSDLDASKIIAKYLKEDRDKIASLEKQERHNQEEGLLPHVRSAGLKAELLAARTQLAYHEGVERYLHELSENKKDRDHFEANCKALYELNNELDEIHNEYEGKTAYADIARIGVKLAAKKTQIEAKKTIMKAIKF